MAIILSYENLAEALDVYKQSKSRLKRWSKVMKAVNKLLKQHKKNQNHEMLDLFLAAIGFTQARATACKGFINEFDSFTDKTKRCLQDVKTCINKVTKKKTSTKKHKKSKTARSKRHHTAAAAATPRAGTPRARAKLNYPKKFQCPITTNFIISPVRFTYKSPSKEKQTITCDESAFSFEKRYTVKGVKGVFLKKYGTFVALKDIHPDEDLGNEIRSYCESNQSKQFTVNLTQTSSPDNKYTTPKKRRRSGYQIRYNHLRDHYRDTPLSEKIRYSASPTPSAKSAASGNQRFTTPPHKNRTGAGAGAGAGQATSTPKRLAATPGSAKEKSFLRRKVKKPNKGYFSCCYCFKTRKPKLRHEIYSIK